MTTTPKASSFISNDSAGSKSRNPSDTKNSQASSFISNDSAGSKSRSPSEKYKLRASLHNHTSSDRTDPIPYSNKELIDHAAKQGFRILAITCHNKWVGSKKLIDYAKSKGILLIPGTEQSIKMRHIIILNSTPQAEKIHTFEALRKYKKDHPNCFIIAAHPFFLGPNTWHNLIGKNIDCFDGIELSWWYSKFFNLNKRGKALAKKHHLPFIGTSDTHNIKWHGITHCEIAAKESSIEAVFKALKKGRFRNITKPVSIWQMLLMPLIGLRDKAWFIKERLKNIV